MCMLSTKIRCFEEETKRSQNVILVSFEREREREREKNCREREDTQTEKAQICFFKVIELSL